MTARDEVKVSVDTVLLTLKEDRLHVALAPLEGIAGAPCLLGRPLTGGGDIELETVVKRTLFDYTGLSDVYFEQLFTFSHRDIDKREPRSLSISVAYLALAPPSKLARAEQTGNGLITVPVDDLPVLPFDHSRIIEVAVSRLRSKGAWSIIPAHFLDEEFTISQLNRVYSAVTSSCSIGQNFRRKVIEHGMLSSAGFKSAPGATKRTEHFRIRPGVSTIDIKI
ncbi:NUDIX hydrolase [Ensifer sp. ENS07]|uniref:NUDIX hydrolase n=1 Tax=unclassified Ensifer TaxID=2633371 RepID=UPI00177D6238|nr:MULTISPECIES: NUDIX hydrolase [unclassified Ensifer]MBD9507913.1 NUDIX hydrolase [Ensifer sp. ENS10]MBD9641219.1 NUDIX hydrolase [Ensifer sp. ENS07]